MRPTDMLAIMIASFAAATISLTSQADETINAKVYSNRSSCAWWLSSAMNRETGNAYLLGLWSGSNIWNTYNHAVGGDAESIFAEVAQICAARPALSLLRAGSEIYSRQMRRARGLPN